MLFYQSALNSVILHHITVCVYSIIFYCWMLDFVCIKSIQLSLSTLVLKTVGIDKVSSASLKMCLNKQPYNIAIPSKIGHKFIGMKLMSS